MAGSEFAGKAVVVTGAAQGIGRTIAEQFVDQGARVVIFDLDGALAAQTAQQIAPNGDSVVSVAGDVSNRGDVRRTVETCVERFGGLDIMVAHAGIADAQPFLEIEEDSWQRILDVNVNGVFLCTQEAGRVMAERGGGAIVVTASTNSFWVEENLSHYNTSKGAVVAFVRSAALDLSHHGIRVNAVAPGVVLTRIAAWVTEDKAMAEEYLAKIPLHRFGETVDVANMVLFLASDKAAYVTGQTIVLDGGLTLGLMVEAPSEPIAGSARSA